MTLEFSRDRALMKMPDLNVSIQGKSFELAGMREARSFAALGCDEKSVALMARDSEGKNKIVVYHFESEDVMWVYPDAAIDGLAVLNIREFFAKQR